MWCAVPFICIKLLVVQLAMYLLAKYKLPEQAHTWLIKAFNDTTFIYVSIFVFSP